MSPCVYLAPAFLPQKPFWGFAHFGPLVGFAPQQRVRNKSSDPRNPPSSPKPPPSREEENLAFENWGHSTINGSLGRAVNGGKRASMGVLGS